ncbi:hypothetical protein ABW19_dt0203115 [Dactylella cylindrospora]|nr:hypothetical protein ABW19_dt0203115 [Dactylella cylindrospora]
MMLVCQRDICDSQQLPARGYTTGPTQIYSHPNLTLSPRHSRSKMSSSRRGSSSGSGSGSRSYKNIRIMEGKDRATRGWVETGFWDRYKEFIEGWHKDGHSQTEIIRLLAKEKKVVIKPAQLKKKLAEWGLTRRNLKPDEKLFIYVTFHQRAEEGKESKFRFTDADRKNVGSRQVSGIVKNSKEFGSADPAAAVAACTTIEVYTPKSNALESESESEPESDPKSSDQTQLPEFPDYEFGGEFLDNLGFEFQGIDFGGAGGGDHQYQFSGDMQELMDTFPDLGIKETSDYASPPVSPPSLVEDLEDEAPRLVEICEQILRSVDDAANAPAEPWRQYHVNLSEEEIQPRAEYRRDLEGWIDDERHKARGIVSQVATAMEETPGLSLEEASALVLEQHKQLNGMKGLPYEVCLAILDEGSAYRPKNANPGDLVADYFDWTPVFDLYHQYYARMEEFTKRYWFKVTFGMRIAHLPYLYATYGPLHFFTIRSLYACIQVMRFLNFDLSEMTLVTEVLLASFISVGMVDTFHGSRTLLQLVKLYKLAGRAPESERLFQLYKVDDIPETEQILDLAENYIVYFLTYLEDGLGENLYLAADAQSAAFGLLQPLMSSTSIAPGYASMVSEDLQQLGRGYLYINQPDKAVEIFQQSLKAMDTNKQSFGTSFGNFTYGVRYMAQAYRQMQKYADSLGWFKMSLEWHVKTLGLDHKDTVGTIGAAVEVMNERGLVMYTEPIVERIGRKAGRVKTEAEECEGETALGIADYSYVEESSRLRSGQLSGTTVAAF